MGILPILIVMFFILVMIILFVFLGGLAMFIVGLVTKIRAKSKKVKKIYPNVLLCLSIPIMLLPTILFLSMGINMYYALRDSDEVFNNKLDEFIEASNNGDDKAIYELFSSSAQNAELEEQIDEFLEIYPDNPNVDLIYCNETENLHGEGARQVLEGFFVISKDGEDYYCYMVYTSVSYSDEYDEGIGSFSIQSPEVYCDESFEFPDDDGLYINIKDDYDYETARIEGYPYIFTPYDRTITEDQVKEFFNSGNDFDEFKSKFGEPNVSDGDLSFSYELQSVNGNKRYLRMYVNHYNSTISSATIVDDLGEYYDIIFDEDELY